MLCSSEFADLLLGEERDKLVSVGRFALKGVGKAKELFTLDPSLAAADTPPKMKASRRRASVAKH